MPQSRKHKKKTGQAAANMHLPHWAVCLLLASVTFAVFYPSLGNEFTNWDDHLYVTENPALANLSAQTVSEIFTSPMAANYHPLTMLSFSLNYKVSGNNPKGYILVNLLLHLLNVLLVYRLVLKLANGNMAIAGLTALLFGIHPMHVESVTWISERKDVLYTFFYLTGLLAYLRYLAKPDAAKYLLVLLLFVLSVLSKPAAVVFPLTLLLLDWFRNRQTTTRSLLEKLPFLAIAAAIGITTMLIQSEEGAMSEITYFSASQKLAFASYGLLTYVYKLFLPVKLSAFYPYPISGNTQALPLLFKLAPVAAALALAALFWFGKKSKVLLFGGLFYLINIALVLQLVTVGSAIIADRYTYVPYIGLFFALAHGLYFLSGWLAKSGRTLLRGALGLAVAAALLACGLASHQRCQVWKNSDILWTDVANKFPGRVSGAHYSRGKYYREQGWNDKALEEYSKSINIRPEGYEAWVNRGNIYREVKHDYEKALADYNYVIEHKPDFIKAYNNRGVAYLSMGKYDKAIKDFNKVLELDPNYAKGYLNRGALYFGLDQYPQALADCERAAQLDPRLAKAQEGKGLVLTRLNRNEEAITAFEVALRLQPSLTGNLLNLSQAYYGTGNTKAAKEYAVKAAKAGVQVPEAYWEALNQ